MKSIDDLKKIIEDGMVLVNRNQDTLVINRYANNVIRVETKLVSWKKLQDLIYNSDYHLDIKKYQLSSDSINKKNKAGGQRIAGPGKTLGRNKIDVGTKKKICSFGLHPDAIEKLKILCSKSDISKSQMIENLIYSAD